MNSENDITISLFIVDILIDEIVSEIQPGDALPLSVLLDPYTSILVETSEPVGSMVLTVGSYSQTQNDAPYLLLEAATSDLEAIGEGTVDASIIVAAEAFSEADGTGDIVAQTSVTLTSDNEEETETTTDTTSAMDMSMDSTGLEDASMDSSDDMQMDMSNGIGDMEMTVENNNAYLMAMGEGSRIEIHAADAEKDGWTQLAENAEAGSNTLTLQESTGWEVGDKIAIASTSRDWEEAEEFTILAVSEDGKTITLDGVLAFDHRGETLEYNNGQTGDDYLEWDVDVRAEVALLSRNVTIQGDEDSIEDGYGGHIMAMNGAEMYLEGAEFFRLGQEDLLGKYPIHWHMLGEAEGQYAINNSIHYSYQKGTTIHGTSNLLYEGNVIYDHVGHGLFLEDGSENENHIYGNLVFSTQENENGEPIPTDGGNVSSFWIENTNNYFIGNHAAGSESNGFWIIPQATPHGLSAETYVGDGSTLADLTFISNTGHTNEGDGGAGGTDKTLGIDGILNSDLSFRQATLDGDFGAVIQDFTAYEGNVWLLSTEVIVSDSAIIDTRSFFRHENYIEDTLLAKEDYGAARTVIYRDGGAQLNGVHLADGQKLLLVNTDHQNGADILNNVTYEGTTPANIITWLSDNAVFQKTVIDIDGSFTGVAGTTLIPDTEIGAFKAPPGSEYSEEFASWLTQFTVGATEVTLLNGDGEQVTPDSAFLILRSDGESSDDHPVSKDVRNNGDTNNGYDDSSDAEYEFNTATGMEADVAYLLDADFGDLSSTNPLVLTLNLTHVMEGQSAVYEIPGIAGSYTVTDGGKRVFSFDELLASDESVYFRDDDSGSVFVRLVADDVEVYEDRPVDDLAADYRASAELTMTITGQDDLNHGALELTDDLVAAIEDQSPLDVAELPEVAEADDPNNYYIAYDQKLTEAATLGAVEDTAAQGNFDVNYDVETGQITIFGEFENLASDITTIHLHLGDEGESGDVIFSLSIDSQDSRNGSFEGTATLTAAQAEALLSDGTYLNLHTADNPSGALRAQIEMQQAGDFQIDRPESTSDTTIVTDDMARWSTESSWDGSAPGENDIVVVGPGETIVLDQSTAVKGIIINGGELIIEDDEDLTIELSSDFVLVVGGGLFQAGTEDDLLDTDFTLTLEGDDPDFDLDVTAYVNGEMPNTVFLAPYEMDMQMDDSAEETEDNGNDGSSESYDMPAVEFAEEVNEETSYEPEPEPALESFDLVNAEEEAFSLEDGALLDLGYLDDPQLSFCVETNSEIESLFVRVGEHTQIVNPTEESEEGTHSFEIEIPEATGLTPGETLEIDAIAFSEADAQGDIVDQVGFDINVPEEDDDSNGFFLMRILMTILRILGLGKDDEEPQAANVETSEVLLSDLIPMIESTAAAPSDQEEDEVSSYII